jgi:hypothetical protein
MSISISVKPSITNRPVPLVRGQSRPRARGGAGIRLAALRVPLVAKLVGANLGVVAVLTAAWVASGAVLNAEVLLAILAVLVLHLVVIGIALRPIQDLEAVASRVWKGDFAARVEQSAVADDQVLRVGAMFNLLLDGLVADRARMRALAAEVIEVGDRERAALARELHDSTAQRLAALMLQVSAAARDAKDPALAARLAEIRDAAEEVTEEVRLLSHTVHPRVLDDLGLVPALRKLARDSSAGTGVGRRCGSEHRRRRHPTSGRGHVVSRRAGSGSQCRATCRAAPGSRGVAPGEWYGDAGDSRRREGVRLARSRATAAGNGPPLDARARIARRRRALDTNSAGRRNRDQRDRSNIGALGLWYALY